MSSPEIDGLVIAFHEEIHAIPKAGMNRLYCKKGLLLVLGSIMFFGEFLKSAREKISLAFLLGGGL